MSSRHHINLEPLCRWHTTIYTDSPKKSTMNIHQLSLRTSRVRLCDAGWAHCKVDLSALFHGAFQLRLSVQLYPSRGKYAPNALNVFDLVAIFIPKPPSSLPLPKYIK